MAWVSGRMNDGMFRTISAALRFPAPRSSLSGATARLDTEAASASQLRQNTPLTFAELLVVYSWCVFYTSPMQTLRPMMGGSNGRADLGALGMESNPSSPMSSA